MLHFLGWLVVGGVAGWLAGKIVSGHGYGIIGDVLLGIVGAFVGGFLFRDVFFHLTTIGHFITSFIGAVIVVGIVHLVRREPTRV